MNIALCSPNKNAYSETFIQAHKRLLTGKIFYFYDGDLPGKLENGLVINSRKRRLIDIFKGHLNLNKFSLAQQALLTSFRKNSIDIVFAEYGTTGMRLLPICKELQIPLIVHFHGFDASRKKVLKENDYYHKLFDDAKFLIVVSKKMENDLLKWGCPREKLVYNPCGPADEFFNVKPLFNKPKFIAAGRFVDKKSPYYLVLAFKEVVKKIPDAQLVIGGQGKLWNSCKNLISYFGLEENVKLPGVISPEEFRKHLSESLAFLQHSITALNGDTEGAPVAILEAAAAGLPVISTLHAGIPDIIEDGKNGILIKEHDVKGMEKAILKFLKNPNLAQEMGDRSRERINNHFTLEKHIQKLNELLLQVVE